MPLQRIDYWDAAEGKQKFRYETPAEMAEREGRTTAPTVPSVVPMLNAHLTLITYGWMTAARQFLAAMEGDEGERARAYFDKALTMERNHPLTLGISAAIGKTEAEVDALFIAAGALNV